MLTSGTLCFGYQSHFGVKSLFRLQVPLGRKCVPKNPLALQSGVWTRRACCKRIVATGTLWKLLGHVFCVWCSCECTVAMYRDVCSFIMLVWKYWMSCRWIVSLRIQLCYISLSPVSEYAMVERCPEAAFFAKLNLGGFDQKRRCKNGEYLGDISNSRDSTTVRFFWKKLF
jgi:hypothetical protein